MSDRVAVVDEGRIRQVGTPTEIYDHPASAFVADFVGVSNFVRGDLARRLTGDDGVYSLRPERITLARPGEVTHGLTVPGTVRSATFTGPALRCVVAVEPDTELTVTTGPEDGTPAGPGDEVLLAFEREHLVPVADDVPASARPDPGARPEPEPAHQPVPARNDGG